jgi:hypothetical protein
MAIEHIRPKNSDGSAPTPAEQIVIDLMALVLTCVSVGTDTKAELLLDLLVDFKFGFGDDVLVERLKEKGYHVEMTNHSFTVSVPAVTEPAAASIKVPKGQAVWVQWVENGQVVAAHLVLPRDGSGERQVCLGCGAFTDERDCGCPAGTGTVNEER